MTSQTKQAVTSFGSLADFAPDWIAAPGDTIADLLGERGWTQVELAQRTGFTTKHINLLLKGGAPITQDTAMKLEKVLGSTARFWLGLEAQYREQLARKADVAALAFLGAERDAREFPNKYVPLPNSLGTIEYATTTPATPLNDAHPGGFLFFLRLGNFRGTEELMLFNKPPLAVPDQIRLLKERDMVFADEARATRVLQHINYYRLRAYWLPFEAQLSARPAHAQHAFKPGTEFDTVVALYIFDRKLRLLLLEAIERVEIAMRTHWAQVLAERYGSHAYLQSTLFQKPAIFDACLKSMDEELLRSKETFVQHYLEKYTNPSRPPIWAICELLTLGQLSKWLGNVKLRNDRQAMAHRLGLDEVVVCAFAHHLTHVRNLCAHHSRVWNRKLTFTMTLPRRPSELAVQFNAPEDRRIYNTLVMLAWCIKTISPDTTWPKRMHALLSARTFDELKAMGAPADWASRATWL